MNRRLGVADLLPTGEQLMDLAYTSMAGDPATYPVGRHAGRAPDRLDAAGLSKRMVYDHARSKDLGWFEAHGRNIEADAFKWPPSRRTMVPKDRTKGRQAGHRPIDDPAEFKRLVALQVRRKLEKMLVARFTAGQLGGRLANASPVFCNRKGATPQDHVATAIWKAIREGYRWCVLIDLEDAFGRVPEQLALRELNRTGLDDAAAKFVWNLVRIHAVLDHRQAVPITRDRMGIEQGNPLSAAIMNLVLAPVLRRLEARLDVQAFTYLDDIYLLAPTEQQATEAYWRFRQVAQGLGFANVRRLWTPGRMPKGKLSQVVDTKHQPVRVLKTYEVDALGVSLAPEKQAELVADLRGSGTVIHRMTIDEVRRLSRCQALTAQAMRARTNLMRGSNTKTSATPPSGTCSPSTPSGGSSSDTITKGTNPFTITDGNPASSLLRAKLTDSEQPSPPGAGTPLKDSNPSYPGKASSNGGSNLRAQVHGDEVGLPLLLLVDLECGHPLGGTRASRGPLSVGEVHLPGHHLLRGEGDHGGVHHHRLGGPAVVASQDQQAGGAPSLGTGRGSARSEGPDESRAGNRADDGDRPVPHLLRVIDAAVQNALAMKRGFKFGDNYKGAVLDLTGLADLRLPDHQVVEVVNGLVRSVRTRGRAAVVIDPAEPWTANPVLLGHKADAVYWREATTSQADGRRVVVLRHRRHGLEHHRNDMKPPKGAADAVLSVRCVDRARFIYELRVVEDGMQQTVRTEVNAESPINGAAEAVAKWASMRTSKRIALPMVGALKALGNVLVEGCEAAASIDYGDAVRSLLVNRRWRVEGEWGLSTR